MESCLIQNRYGLCAFLFLFLITVGNSVDSTSSGNSTIKNDNTRPNSTTKSLIEVSDKPFRCYTCSWSEMANFSTPNIDACSSYKFVPEAAGIVACDYGCQTVSYRTTKSSDVRHFHRNCLKRSADRESRDKCVINYSKSYGFEEICECMTNLCNGASSYFGSHKFQASFIWLVIVIQVILQCGPGWQW